MFRLKAQFLQHASLFAGNATYGDLYQLRRFPAYFPMPIAPYIQAAAASQTVSSAPIGYAASLIPRQTSLSRCGLRPWCSVKLWPTEAGALQPEPAHIPLRVSILQAPFDHICDTAEIVILKQYWCSFSRCFFLDARRWQRLHHLPDWLCLTLLPQLAVHVRFSPSD